MDGSSLSFLWFHEIGPVGGQRERGNEIKKKKERRKEEKREGRGEWKRVKERKKGGKGKENTFFRNVKKTGLGV